MTILSSVAIIVSGKECLKDWLIVGRVTRAIHMGSHNGYGYESASSFPLQPILGLSCLRFSGTRGFGIMLTRSISGLLA